MGPDAHVTKARRLRSRPRIIAAWGRRAWRWVHWELAAAAVLFSFVLVSNGDPGPKTDADTKKCPAHTLARAAHA